MVINTTKGEIDSETAALLEAAGRLEKREGRTPEGAAFVEYWLDGELVHRSVTAGLSGVEAAGVAQRIG